MAFDTSGLTPSVDDSHVVSSEKLKAVNFSGNLGCDFFFFLAQAALVQV